MAIENVELMHVCFPKYLRRWTARMKQDKATDEEGKKRGAKERSKADTKKKRISGWITKLFNTYNKSTEPWRDNINKHNMTIFYEKWKKYN